MYERVRPHNTTYVETFPRTKTMFYKEGTADTVIVYSKGGEHADTVG